MYWLLLWLLAPATIKLLKKSATKYGDGDKKISKIGMVGIYFYAIAFGPAGFFVALLSQ